MKTFSNLQIKKSDGKTDWKKTCENISKEIEIANDQVVNPLRIAENIEKNKVIGTNNKVDWKKTAEKLYAILKPLLEEKAALEKLEMENVKFLEKQAFERSLEKFEQEKEQKHRSELTEKKQLFKEEAPPSNIGEDITKYMVSVLNKMKHEERIKFFVIFMIETKSFIPLEILKKDVELAQAIYEAYCEAHKDKTDKEAWNNWRRELKGFLNSKGVKYSFETQGCKPISLKKLHWVNFNFDSKINALLEQGLVLVALKDRVECSKFKDGQSLKLVIFLDRKLNLYFLELTINGETQLPNDQTRVSGDDYETLLNIVNETNAIFTLTNKDMDKIRLACVEIAKNWAKDQGIPFKHKYEVILQEEGFFTLYKDKIEVFSIGKFDNVFTKLSMEEEQYPSKVEILKEIRDYLTKEGLDTRDIYPLVESADQLLDKVESIGGHGKAEFIQHICNIISTPLNQIKEMNIVFHNDAEYHQIFDKIMNAIKSKYGKANISEFKEKGQRLSFKLSMNKSIIKIRFIITSNKIEFDLDKSMERAGNEIRLWEMDSEEMVITTVMQKMDDCLKGLNV